jgi:hypothetical protein
MLVRVVRAAVGAGLLLVGLPLLLAGGVLWFAVQHQDPAGGYTAPLTPIRTDGYAVVASDVDALLRRTAPFTRSGQTTVRLTARTGSGPAFIGLAPVPEVARYLAEVPYARVDEVRLARGPLPVVTAPVDGSDQPAGAPQDQPFWRTSSGAGILEWSPDELRDQRLALVVMDPEASAPLTVDLTARVDPRWLGSTTLGLLVLGTVLLLVAVTALVWPGRPREIVYVVPPAQLPELAARLGAPVPRTAAGLPAAEPFWTVPVRDSGAFAGPAWRPAGAGPAGPPVGAPLALSVPGPADELPTAGQQPRPPADAAPADPAPADVALADAGPASVAMADPAPDPAGPVTDPVPALAPTPARRADAAPPEAPVLEWPLWPDAHPVTAAPVAVPVAVPVAAAADQPAIS